MPSSGWTLVLSPASVASGRSADHAARPRIDGGKLLGFFRATLGGDGPANLASLPTLVAAASEGETDPLLEEVLGDYLTS